jgi:hypothetical protein
MSRETYLKAYAVIFNFINSLVYIFTVFALLCVMIFGILAVNTAIKINQPNCLYWLYLITATYFGPHLGPSSGSLIKYVSCYSNMLLYKSILVLNIIII